MMHHYPDLRSVSDWLKMCLNQSAALLGLLLQDQVTDTKIKELHLILGLGYLKDSNAAAHSFDTGIS